MREVWHSFLLEHEGHVDTQSHWSSAGILSLVVSSYIHLIYCCVWTKNSCCFDILLSFIFDLAHCTYMHSPVHHLVLYVYVPGAYSESFSTHTLAHTPAHTYCIYTLQNAARILHSFDVCVCVVCVYVCLCVCVVCVCVCVLSTTVESVEGQSVGSARSRSRPTLQWGSRSPSECVRTATLPSQLMSQYTYIYSSLSQPHNTKGSH